MLLLLTTGQWQCKFGMTCKFHHPQLSGMSAPTSAPSFYPVVQPSPEQYGESLTQWKVDRTLLPGSYVQGSYGSMLIPPGIVPVPGWTLYSGSMNPVESTATESDSATGPNPPLLPPYTSAPSGQSVQTFPERLGESECQYHLRSRDCKYRSSGKYHHPKQWSVPAKNYEFSPWVSPCVRGLGLVASTYEPAPPENLTIRWTRWGTTSYPPHPQTSWSSPQPHLPSSSPGITSSSFCAPPQCKATRQGGEPTRHKSS